MVISETRTSTRHENAVVHSRLLVTSSGVFQLRGQWNKLEVFGLSGYEMTIIGNAISTRRNGLAVPCRI